MSILRKIQHLLHPRQGEIWCLHRVLPVRSCYPANRELEITPDYLEQLINRYIAKGYRFVSLDEILKHQSLFIPQKRVHITFDDGFKDVYTYAYPILKKYHIPFTIYLSSDFPDGKADIWWIQLEQCCTPQESVELMKQIYANPASMPITMHQLTHTQPDYNLTKTLALSWNEIRRMVSEGLCAIGTHSASHVGLNRISVQQAEEELVRSREEIDNHLGIMPVHMSYPHSMYNNDVVSMVKRIGYCSATLGYGGSIRRADNPYLLNRVYIVQ